MKEAKENKEKKEKKEMKERIITKEDLIGESLPVKELAKPYVKKEVIDILYENGFQVCEREFMAQLLKDSLTLAKIKAKIN